MNNAIYLDHNSTTPLDDEVLAAMLPFFPEHFGNPSSPHVFGRIAQEAVELARQAVADGDPAYVLEAIDKPETAHCSARFQAGRTNTQDQMQTAIEYLSRGIRRIKSFAV